LDKTILDLRGQLLFKAEGSSVREIHELLKSYAKYEDFKMLYHKCMPAVQKIEQEIIDVN
jgi:hypothetical protein